MPTSNAQALTLPGLHTAASAPTGFVLNRRLSSFLRSHRLRAQEFRQSREQCVRRLHCYSNANIDRRRRVAVAPRAPLREQL